MDRPRTKVIALAAAEAASAVYALVSIVNYGHVAALVRENVGPRRLRYVLALGAVLAAGLTAAVLYFRTREERSGERIRLWTHRLAPVLVAWCIPGLFSRRAFEGRELALLLLLAGAVVAFEASGRLTFQRWELTWKAPASFAYGCLTVLVVAYVSLASWGSIRLHQRLFTSLFDLGMFENLLWNTLHGVHGISANGRYFGEHVELILYPLLPVYALFPRPETLLVLQSMFLGGAAVPLYLLAKRWLGSAWQPLILVGAFLLFPAVHGPNFYDFHFLTLSVFFVLWAAYFFSCARWGAFWAAVALSLACREDVSIGALAVGASLAVLGIRRRVGIALALLGSIWFVSIKLLWMRSIGGDAFVEHYAGLVPAKSSGFKGVFLTLVSNPLFVLPFLATSQKLILALQLLTPLAFLPVRRVRNLFLLLPGVIVVGLTTGEGAPTRVNFQYVAHFVPYLFIACAAALAKLRGAHRSAALAAVVLGSVVATTHFGAALRDKYTVSYHEVGFSWSAGDAERLEALRSLTARIPSEASVAASDAEGAHVARRRQLNGVKEGLQGAEYVLYGLTSLRWGGTDQVETALKSGEYGVLASRDEFVLLARGASTTANAAELKRLR